MLQVFWVIFYYKWLVGFLFDFIAVLGFLGVLGWFSRLLMLGPVRVPVLFCLCRVVVGVLCWFSVILLSFMGGFFFLGFGVVWVLLYFWWLLVGGGLCGLVM